MEEKDLGYRGRLGMCVSCEYISTQELVPALGSFPCCLDALKVETGPHVKDSPEIDDRGYQQEKQRENESQLDERLALAMRSTHESLRNDFSLVIMHHGGKCKWGSKKRRSRGSGASR